jgi:cytochrome c-type biogenesis protein CcmH/NrfF
LLGLAVLSTALHGVAASADRAYDAAARMILCDCGCHPQSVHECACGRAAEMRDEIRRMADDGLDEDAIVARYVERHGEQIRIAPPATGFNLVAWVGPALGLGLAGGLLVLTLRRWQRKAHAQQILDASQSPLPSLDAEAEDRLRRALGEVP